MTGKLSKVVWFKDVVLVNNKQLVIFPLNFCGIHVHFFVPVHSGSKQNSTVHIYISSNYFLYLLLINSETLTDQMGYVLPPALPQGILPTGCALNTCSERLPEPPQQALSNPKEKLVYSKPLLDVKALYSVPKDEAQDPAKELHF